MIILQDSSFEEYTSYLNDNRENIRELLYLSEDSPVRKIYEPVFRENFTGLEQNQQSNLRVAATDSSEFIRELYNGKKLILSRSFTKFGDEVHTRFISRVMSVDREDMNTFMVMLMEHLEHRSVIDFLESGPEADAVLVDGSITGRLFHRRSKLNAEGFEDFPAEYYSTLGKLISASETAGIPLVFQAKSSETTIFRRYLSECLNRESAEDAKITDHLLVKSLADSSGYTFPVKAKYSVPSIGMETEVSTFHILPDTTDVPLKVDYVHSGDEDSGKVPEEIIRMLFYGYAGYKVYNLWLSDVDNAVKFRKQEVESIFMKEFERRIGIQFYETRGERRVRTRI